MSTTPEPAASKYEQDRQRFAAVVDSGHTHVQRARMWMGASLVQLCCSGLLVYVLWALHQQQTPRRLVAAMGVVLVITVALHVAARRMLTLADAWLPSDRTQTYLVYAQRTLFASVLTSWVIVLTGSWVAIFWTAVVPGFITAGLIVWLLCVNGWNAKSQLEMCLAITDNSSAQALQTAMRRRYWAEWPVTDTKKPGPQT